MVPEAELEQTEAGLVPASASWFVMNARDAGWFQRPGRDSLPLTGCDEFEAETRHVFVGTGDGPCVILAASSRQFQKDGPWGYYPVDEAARRHNACPAVETQDGNVAYAHVTPVQPSRYRDGVL